MKKVLKDRTESLSNEADLILPFYHASIFKCMCFSVLDPSLIFPFSLMTSGYCNFFFFVTMSINNEWFQPTPCYFLYRSAYNVFSIWLQSDFETSTSEVYTVSKNADDTLFHGDICGPIAATMNEAMFLLVISKWHDAFDGLKETNDYKFLSASGSLMKDMVRYAT